MTVVIAAAVSSPAALAADTGTGGAEFVPRPEIRSVSCLADCARGRTLRGTSRMRVKGSALRAVRTVVFNGGSGTGDDVKVSVSPRSDRALELVVPAGAPSGPVTAVARNGTRSRPSRSVPVLPPPPPPPATPELTPVAGPRDSDSPLIETGTSVPRKVFFGQARKVTFSYRVSHASPVEVQVDLVNAADGAVVRSWSPPPAEPGEVASLAWSGVTPAGPAPDGRYAFRLTARGEEGRSARSAQAGDPHRDAFDFYGHIFPIRGRHDFGQAGARFGTGRAGHSHQGQDVFAPCGTRMVAARGGKVRFSGYHAAAGHYLVIRGDRSDVDYAYMHMTGPAPFARGARVYTGQDIGTVGESGNARGCHLHFEMWGAPGWYDGGSAFDPLPHLQAWDGVS